MSKTAVYIRVSTDRQSTASQKRVINRWLDGHGVEPVWYIDKASGAKMARKAFCELQEAIFMGEVDHVVMYSIDRFARNLVDGLMEIDRWQQAKVRVTFVADAMDIDFGTWQGDIMCKLIIAIKLAFSEQERQRLKERQAAGIASAKERAARAKEMYEAGVPLRKIAAELGVDPDKARKWAQLGTPYAGGKKGRTKYDRKRILDLLKKGLPQTEVARLVGCHRLTVMKVKRDAERSA